jgi:hypothetical protein
MIGATLIKKYTVPVKFFSDKLCVSVALIMKC